MTTAPYLLDTGILLLLVRGGALGKYVRATFKLDDAVFRPLVSIVAHGEIWVLADRNHWGTEKRQSLRELLEGWVTMDINNQEVLDAYVELDRVSQDHPDGARALSDNDL